MYKISIVEDDMDIAQTLKNQLDKYERYYTRL